MVTWTPASSPTRQGTGQGVLALAELGHCHHGQSENGFVTPRGASLPQTSLGRGLLCFAAANPPTASVTLPVLHVSYEWNQHHVTWGSRPLPCHVVVSRSATCSSCPLLGTHSGSLGMGQWLAARTVCCLAGGAEMLRRRRAGLGANGCLQMAWAHTGRGPAGPHCASVSPPPRGTDHIPWFQPPWRNPEAGPEAAPPLLGMCCLGKKSGAGATSTCTGPCAQSRASLTVKGQHSARTTS